MKFTNVSREQTNNVFVVMLISQDMVCDLASQSFLEIVFGLWNADNRETQLHNLKMNFSSRYLYCSSLVIDLVIDSMVLV